MSSVLSGFTLLGQKLTSTQALGEGTKEDAKALGGEEERSCRRLNKNVNMMKMEENQNENIPSPTLPLADTETPPVSQLSQPPFGSWWKVGGLVLGAVILAGGIFFAGYQYSQKQAPLIAYPTVIPTPTSSPINQTTPSLTSTVDPTTNWDTFKNSYGSYVMKIPPEFGVIRMGMSLEKPESAPAIRIFQKGVTDELKYPHLNITVIPKSESNFTLEQEANKNYETNIKHKSVPEGTPSIPVERIHQTSFLEEKSYQYSFRSKGIATYYEEYDGYEGVYKTIWVEHNNKYFMIVWADNPKLNQAVSTLRFD